MSCNMERCKSCNGWIKDHRYDLILHIAKSCADLRKFDENEKKIYPEYVEDNAQNYLDNMNILHDLTSSEQSFILAF